MIILHKEDICNIQYIIRNKLWILVIDQYKNICDQKVKLQVDNNIYIEVRDVIYSKIVEVELFYDNID